MEHQLVVFTLADEDYGVDISTVDSIVKMQAITQVPHAPSFVEGITNMRGEVLPVIDLRKRFGLPTPSEAFTKETRLVNVELGGLKIGMVVDAVTEVLSISEEEIEPPSPITTTVDSAFITGIAKVEERLIILLDLDKVLSTEEQANVQAMPQTHGDSENENGNENGNEMG